MSGIGRQFSFRAALPMKGGFAVYARLLEESATLASADAPRKATTKGGCMKSNIGMAR